MCTVKRVLKKLFWALFWDFWKAIPFSLAGAMLGAFFIVVVFRGGDFNFVEVWRSIYLVVLLIAFLWDILAYFCMAVFIAQYAKKVQASTADVAEASFDFKLTLEKDYMEWDSAKFGEWLSIHRSARVLAQAVTKSLLG